MSHPTTEKIALVTGANRGIGREVARQLARRGFRVFLGARDAAGRQADAEGEAAAGRAIFLPLDVSDSAGIRAAAAAFSRHADRLDVLVNNAGIYPDQGT